MLQKSNTENVLEVFFRNPSKEFELMEISRNSRLAHTSVKKILDSLLKEKIILKKTLKKGKREFPIYFSNLNSQEFTNLKKLNNLKQIIFSGLVEKLEETFMPDSIILFGSYSRGEDTEESDIDLFIESSEEQFNLKKYEKTLGRKINILFGSLSNLNKNLKENVLSGVLLKGTINL